MNSGIIIATALQGALCWMYSPCISRAPLQRSGPVQVEMSPKKWKLALLWPTFVEPSQKADSKPSDAQRGREMLQQTPRTMDNTGEKSSQVSVTALFLTKRNSSG